MPRLPLLAAATLVASATPAATPSGCVTPANETCAGQIVFETADLPYHDSGLIGCVNDVIDKPYWDIFYRYECTISGEHTFEMCDSDGDTYIRIYTGGCGWADGQEFAVADDECPGSPPNADPRLTVQLEAGTTYYWIELGTWRPDPPWGDPNLPFLFRVTLDATCLGDANVDGAVDTSDMLGLLAAWGTSQPAYDLDGDGNVGVLDFLALLAAWGPCP